MNSARDSLHVTRLFPRFVGLRLLPAGLFFIAMTLPAMGPLDTGNPRVWALVAVALAAMVAIHAGYRRRFGVVELERLGLARNRAALAGLAVAWAALALGGTALGVDRVVVPLVLVVLFTAAAIFRPLSFTAERWGIVLFVATAALAGIALVALPHDGVALGATGARFSIALGVLLCLAGVLEHASLRRALVGATAAVAERSGEPA